LDLAKDDMRIFLFKLLFKLTWWLAPDTRRVNMLFEMYMEMVEREEEMERCKERQDYLDRHTQPRTETYEHLTCKNQRNIYTKNMPPRISDQDQPRSHYSDYEEAKAYHDGA
jgi:hypothetical protein